MNNNDIMVTVFCTAYNHGKYIRQCLDGFVMQNTNFKYEVIIHEDASTDYTADIIREYEKQYPSIIKPIFQTENQRNKGFYYIEEFCLKNAKGKYIALCEGDDFWTDELKLQKQFDAMEAHPSCKLCLCKVRATEENGEKMDLTYPRNDMPTSLYKEFSLLEIICKEYSFQTSCYFFDKATLAQYFEEKPTFMRVAPVGDWPYLLYFSQYGIYYIDDEMSCYRKNAVGSFSTNIHQATIEKQKIYYKGMIAMMEEYDKYTNNRFHTINTTFRFYEYYYYTLIQGKNYKEIFRNKKFKQLLEKESRSDRMSIKCQYYFPWLYKMLRKIKHCK